MRAKQWSRYRIQAYGLPCTPGNIRPRDVPGGILRIQAGEIEVKGREGVHRDPRMVYVLAKSDGRVKRDVRRFSEEIR